MELYVLAFVVEMFIGEVKLIGYTPTNGPLVSLRECKLMKEASATPTECVLATKLKHKLNEEQKSDLDKAERLGQHPGMGHFEMPSEFTDI